MLNKLLEDPGLSYPIYDLNLSFKDYIKACQTLITTHRLDLQRDATTIIDANTPREWRSSGKNKTGALLIHGLFDSPFLMRDVGDYFYKNDILARSLLLPGHGTVPGALLNTRYEDWLQTLRYGINSLAKEVDRIILVGFSTGALVEYFAALTEPLEKVIGLVLMSPAFKINSRLDFMSHWHKSISWLLPRAHWFQIAKEIDYAQYQSIPFNAVYQVYRLTRHLQKINHTKPLPYPLFIALSEDDSTVSSSATLNYFLQTTHPDNKLLLYSHKNHNRIDPRIVVRKSVYPEWNIVSSSHIAIPNAPTNPHYGLQGDFIYASHVGTEKDIIYGETNVLNTRRFLKSKKQRLTFNPDFELMMKSVVDWCRVTS